MSSVSDIKSLETPELPAKTLASILAFPLVAILFTLMLLCYEALMFTCELLGTRATTFSRIALQNGCYYFLYLLGTRINIQVDEPLETDRPYIFVTNHQSMFDIPLLFKALRPKSPRYISKKELAKKIPAISRYLKTDGSALIERDNPRQALPAIKALAREANSKRFGVAIFPEGTRSRDGKLKPFRVTGLKILAQNAPDAIILPVVIDGSWKFTCYPKGPIPLGIQVMVRTGKPVARENKEAEELVKECRQQVEAMLEDIRKNCPAG